MTAAQHCSTNTSKKNQLGSRDKHCHYKTTAVAQTNNVPATTMDTLQREGSPERPLTAQDKRELQFLYDEWSHPYFISIQEFVRIMQVGLQGSQLCNKSFHNNKHEYTCGLAEP